MKVTAQTVPRHRTRNSTITHGDRNPGASITVVTSSPIATVVDNSQSSTSGSEVPGTVCDNEVLTVDKTPVSNSLGVDVFGEAGNRKVVFEGDGVTGLGDWSFTGSGLEYVDDNCVVMELDGMKVASDASESS